MTGPIENIRMISNRRVSKSRVLGAKVMRPASIKRCPGTSWRRTVSSARVQARCHMSQKKITYDLHGRYIQCIIIYINMLGHVTWVFILGHLTYWKNRPAAQCSKARCQNPLVFAAFRWQLAPFLGRLVVLAGRNLHVACHICPKMS